MTSLFNLKNGYDIQHGDTLNLLKQLPDNSVDSIVTDPPYGLHFMLRKWDVSVPSVEVWQECLRVLKPGGHLVAFAGTRTQHRMATYIEDAGFEIRDMLAWLYGSGFPKSKNLGDGFGTALKPAMEPITLARKPLVGTVVDNVLAQGTGALNIDACRIELNGDYKSKANGRPSMTNLPDGYDPANANQADTVGRWPANVIYDGSDEVLEHFPTTTSGSNCVIKASGSDKQGNTGAAYGAESRPSGTPMISYGDTGSAARFFYCAKASRADRNEGLESSHTPLLNQHATMRERENADWKLRNGNFHPTVKPTSLMRWLVRLVTPLGGICLDPYCGSGTTGKAAILEGFKFIGFDQDFDYVTISIGRCKHAALQPDLFGGAA